MSRSHSLRESTITLISTAGKLFPAYLSDPAIDPSSAGSKTTVSNTLISCKGALRQYSAHSNPFIIRLKHKFVPRLHSKQATNFLWHSDLSFAGGLSFLLQLFLQIFFTDGNGSSSRKHDNKYLSYIAA